MLTRMRHAYPAITYTITCFLCAYPATATVFEYDEVGTLTVTETKEKPATPKRVKTSINTKQQLAYRELSRSVALEFSGKPGVVKAGIDAQTFVDIFEALIDQESDFDPKAVSDKGAIGLGQLLPGTARSLNVVDPFDPHQNLVGSAKYLTKQLFDFGSLELALAAYNAGPDRVKKYGDIPPFEETQNFVVSIMTNAGLDVDASAKNGATSHSKKSNNEPPLEGEKSVWEF